MCIRDRRGAPPPATGQTARWVASRVRKCDAEFLALRAELGHAHVAFARCSIVATMIPDVCGHGP
eukprot:6206337-Lingulodinium_polyedra.AAC.1